jgi:threonine synthase
LPQFRFSSGSSSHADRLNTIRQTWADYGVMIDPHTADGLKVGRALRRDDLPLICLETALPAKFADIVQEALGRAPERPAGLEGLESLSQRYEVMDADVDQLKDFIATHTA